MAEGSNTYTDANGATYTILGQRAYSDTLKATMIEIENAGSVISGGDGFGLRC